MVPPLERGRARWTRRRRATQAPLKERHRAEPDAAPVTLTASGSIDSASIACKLETGRALAPVVGLHPATGGTGAELCSGDLLLEALVACAGVTLKAIATAIDFPLRGGTVTSASLGQGGDGLGTKWGWETAQEMLETAGFAPIRKVKLDHDPLNVWFVSHK